jgi:hypothetical protein
MMCIREEGMMIYVSSLKHLLGELFTQSLDNIQCLEHFDGSLDHAGIMVMDVVLFADRLDHRLDLG